MKTFIATYKIFEGEHERFEYLLIKAKDQEKAIEIAQSQEHEPIIRDKDEELTWWDYGDGSTGATYKWIKEIDPKEAEIIARHGLVHYYDK